jgi:hypothetical protein
MSLATTASTAAVPAHALRRGTRGFAAVVLFLTGMIVSAVTLFVLPSTALTRDVLTILIPLAIIFSVAHFVAMYGLVRRRAWSAPLTLYLAAIGLGLAAFGCLLLVTGLDPFGRPAAEAALESRVQVVGLLVWLAGSWIVAARFAVRGMAPADSRREPAEAADPTRVMVAHPLVIAADATRTRPGLRPHSASFT